MSTVEHTRTDAPPRRVLVTGSRKWANPAVVRDALQQVWGDGDAVLVTGANPSGADRIAEMFWRRWGGRVERHPADWNLHGNKAGFIRNQAMVAKGADVCVAFVRDNSPGASSTVHLAESAGIPVYLHTDNSRSSSSGQVTTNDNPRSTDEADSAPVEVRGSDDLAPVDQPSQPARTVAPTPAAAESAGRVWLDVPYAQKNEAKQLGARWDRQARRWYAPGGITEGLSRWAPGQPPNDPPHHPVEPNTAACEPARDQTASPVQTPTPEQATPEAGERLVSPAEMAALYSYPRIAERIATLPADSEGGRQARAAMALLLEDPGLYEGGDQASAIAAALSAKQIAQHREIVGHGPLFDVLGQAAHLQRNATEEAAEPPADEPAPAHEITADAPMGGQEFGGTVVASSELLSPAEVAAHYSYPEISALLANAPDAQAGRVCREALNLLLNNPDLYTGGDQAHAIAEQFSAEQITQHRRILKRGPLFEVLGRAADLRNNSRIDTPADAHTDADGVQATQATSPAAVSRARQAVDQAHSLGTTRREDHADQQRQQRLAAWTHTEASGNGREDAQDQNHETGDAR